MTQMVEVREATQAELMSRGGVAARAEFGLVLEREHAGVAVRRDAFDSECLGWEILRVLDTWGSTAGDYRTLYPALDREASRRGFDQVLRRVPAQHKFEIWALEFNGYELMDVLVTFARGVDSAELPELPAGVTIEPATDDDVEEITRVMSPEVWASRYESDPTYPVERVAELRRRWIWNSQRGRAAVFLVAKVDGDLAGYIIGLLDEEHGGAIDLIETFSAFRRRGVAGALVHSAVSWFSTRTGRVSVATQATNLAAARLYEHSGFSLDSCDLTYRRDLTNLDDFSVVRG